MGVALDERWCVVSAGAWIWAGLILGALAVTAWRESQREKARQTARMYHGRAVRPSGHLDLAPTDLEVRTARTVTRVGPAFELTDHQRQVLVELLGRELTAEIEVAAARPVSDDEWRAAVDRLLGPEDPRWREQPVASIDPEEAA